LGEGSLRLPMPEHIKIHEEKTARYIISITCAISI
jgi:hypothetical protein